MARLRDCSLRRGFLYSIVLAAFLIVALSFSVPTTYYEYLPRPLSKWAAEHIGGGGKPTAAPVNATLGFQKIFALTKGTPWRVEGLKAAAKLTGVDIDCTPLNVTEEEVTEFKGAHGQGPGAVGSWYGHVKLLRKVKEEGLGSALIMEDDMDFDVRIKDQISAAYHNIAKLMEASKAIANAEPQGPPEPHEKRSILDSPSRNDWDLLWLGSCGDNVAPLIPNMDDFVQNEKIWMYPDESVISKDGYTGWAHSSIYNLPPLTRAALWSVGPVCTYAYAVTSASIDKVLGFASDLNVGFAYDVALHNLCEDRRLTCISVIPELFHEYLPPQSDEITTSELGAADGLHTAEPGDVLKLGMGYTLNIQQSARCRALYDETCFPGRMDPV